MSNILEPDYRNKNITLLKDARVDAISLVDVGANNQRFFMFKRADNVIDEFGNLSITQEPNVQKYLPLIKGGDTEKGEDEWKVAYVVVAIPGEVDQQKDVWDSHGIRDVAHDFLKRGPLINYMHEDMKKVGELTESYLAPQNLNINGQDIKEGSWIIGVEPHPEVKDMIKAGKITGVSVQGSSKRADLPPELTIAKTADGRDVISELYKNFGYDDATMQRPGEDYAVQSPEEPGGEVHRLAPVGAQSMDDQVIPLGAVGPGIAKLQDALGLESTGTYDEDTEAAFIEFLRRTGREPAPSLRMLKFVLQDYDERKALEAQLMAQSAQAAAAPEAGAEVAAAPAPPQEMEKDHVAVAMYPTQGGTAAYNPAGMYGGGEVGDQSGGTYTGQLSLGTHAGNTGINAPVNNVRPESSEDDLKAVIIQSSLQGNELLNSYLRDNLGITDPYQLLYFKISPSVLWAMISAFVFGQDPRMSFAPISSRGVVTTQPSYTPPELFPTGTGYSIQKSAHNKENIQQVLDTLDYHIMTNLNKSGWLDWVTPHAELLDKDGFRLYEGVIVKAPGGQVAEVTSIDMQEGTVNVQWTDAKGVIHTKTHPATKLNAVKRQKQMLKQGVVAMVDKNGFGIDSGAIVKITEDGQVGEVVAFDAGQGKIVVETINKDIELVKRELDPTEVEVINSTKSRTGNPEVQGTPSPEKAALAASQTVVKVGEAVGGSKGGGDPRKFGKIRFIVRGFGKWAGGKHRICVSRLRAEHPEIANGREEALCAWLKDQYVGTTKWRNRGKMYKSYGRFAEVYKQALETGDMDITDEEVNSFFDIISVDLGIDPSEVMDKMSGDETDFDMYLDELFGAIEEEQVPDGIINKFVKLFKSDKSLDEKAKEAEDLLKSSEYADEDKEMKLEAAFTAATSSIESALSKKDEETKLKEIDETLTGLKSWLGDFATKGGNVPALNTDESNEYIAVTWDDEEFIEVDGAQETAAPEAEMEKVEEEPEVPEIPAYISVDGSMETENIIPSNEPQVLAKRGSLEKGWLPSGTAQGDLNDGDFAWLSDAYKSGKASKTEGRKLPYKIHGTVNERGWRAAWNMLSKTNLAGGPSQADVARKLLANKPKSVEIDPDRRKELLNKNYLGGDYEMQPDKKKRRLKTQKTNFTEVNMEKQEMPEGMNGAPAGLPAEGGAPAETGGDKDWVGKTVIGPDGNRYIVIDQSGDMLTVGAGRKRATFSKDEVELADEAGGDNEAAEGEAPVEKEGGTEDKLRSAIQVLTEILGSTAEAESTASPEMPVMKEGTPEVGGDATSLNDVIYFVNGLADQLDEMRDNVAGVSDIGPKLEKVGELVKSVDFSERLDAIEQTLTELKERAGTTAPVDSVEAVSKRLAAIEQQSGSSTQVYAHEEKIEKSADRMFRGLF